MISNKWEQLKDIYSLGNEIIFVMQKTIMQILRTDYNKNIFKNKNWGFLIRHTRIRGYYDLEVITPVISKKIKKDFIMKALSKKGYKKLYIKTYKSIFSQDTLRSFYTHPNNATRLTTSASNMGFRSPMFEHGASGATTATASPDLFVIGHGIWSAYTRPDGDTHKLTTSNMEFRSLAFNYRPESITATFSAANPLGLSIIGTDANWLITSAFIMDFRTPMSEHGAFGVTASTASPYLFVISHGIGSTYSSPDVNAHRPTLFNKEFRFFVSNNRPERITATYAAANPLGLSIVGTDATQLTTSASNMNLRFPLSEYRASGITTASALPDLFVIGTDTGWPVNPRQNNLTRLTTLASNMNNRLPASDHQSAGLISAIKNMTGGTTARLIMSKNNIGTSWWNLNKLFKNRKIILYSYFSSDYLLKSLFDLTYKQKSQSLWFA